MYERLSRFDTQPGDIKIPLAAYPSEPVKPMSRWTVRLAADDGGTWHRPWVWDTHVWAFSSVDAVARARADFYGTWATYEDRKNLPLRVLAVLQEAV